MEDVKFSDVAAAFSRPTLTVKGATLQLATMPKPFVPPSFESDSGPELRSAEVILISASAAVGKSTLARALSATQGIPVLDLAHTPVATGSLIGILNDYTGATSPLVEFHAGNAPVIIDALDEGRLRSGDNSYLSFIETSAQLILQSRQHRKPKLVMLGRAEAIAYAEILLIEAGVDVALLSVGYFGEEGAKELVHAYAAAAAKPDSLYLVHRKPAEELVETYFCKIADALGIPRKDLWHTPSGRSFAGYAPVLAAIGGLLPEVENFVEAQNKLQDARLNSAWGVIENVLEAIIHREQGKMATQLANAGVSNAEGRLYSSQEQLALILQYVQHLPLTGTSTVRLGAADTAKYSDQVSRFLPEHPFIKERKFSNEVIASYVVAKAIENGWKIQDEALLRQLARQPFLWRSLRTTFDDNSILEGEYLGYVLSSFWTDPLTQDETVEVTDKDQGSDSFVAINVKGEAVTFTATTPVHFFGQMRNVTVKTAEPFGLVGIGDGATQAFSFSGDNNVVGSIIDLRANEIRLRSGRTWLDAEVVPATGQVSLAIMEGAEYGWSNQLAGVYPFSMYQSTINPSQEDQRDRLSQLLSDLAAKSPVGTSLMLHPDNSAPENDYLRSIYVQYGTDFQALFATLLSKGWASSAAMQVSGAPKVRVRLKVPFSALRDAALRPSQNASLNELIADLRQKIH